MAGDQGDDPPKLVEEHQQFLINLIDGNPSLVLDEIVTRLTEQFAGLNIKKSALHNFMTKKCKISLKRTHLQSVERNSPEKIEDRHAWVTKWLQTDMDYLSNCVFVDEAAFHVNMKRSYSWSKKGLSGNCQGPKNQSIDNNRSRWNLSIWCCERISQTSKSNSSIQKAQDNR